jgi:hypothetical protein
MPSALAISKLGQVFSVALGKTRGKVSQPFVYRGGGIQINMTGSGGNDERLGPFVQFLRHAAGRGANAASGIAFTLPMQRMETTPLSLVVT